MWRLIVPGQWLSSGLQKGQRPSASLIMESTETIYTNDPIVACDGGKLGHPRVFLSLTPAGEVVCPYCSRHFVLRPGSGEAAAS